MTKKTQILQLGKNSWAPAVASSGLDLEWQFLTLDEVDEARVTDLKKSRKSRTFDAVLCTDQFDEAALLLLSPLIETYSLVLDVAFEPLVSEALKTTKCPHFWSLHQPEPVLKQLDTAFFSGQMGTKLHLNSVEVSEEFSGQVEYSGQHRLKLTGPFSDLGSLPLLKWQYNITLMGRSKSLWLEFLHSPGVSLQLHIVAIGFDGLPQPVQIYEEAQVKAGIEWLASPDVAYLSLSLSVRGKGTLQIGPLHYRESRQGYGEFLLGGKKISDESNEELFYYFHPGDLKPPLNVYFSGFRTAEGFEGFYMMKRLGAPFLLITDPRLDGGAFYLGSKTLEKKLINVIQDQLKALKFEPDQLILSGLSMGTFGALYYAASLKPHTVIVGKPLVNLGQMADNERLIRPGGFPTSLDLLKSQTGALSKVAVTLLNARFWDRFKSGDFNRTQLVMAYMQHDDYDDQAYPDLLEAVMEQETRVIGKGVAGRHNDNSAAINEWFFNHYRRILQEAFGRKEAP